MRGGHVFTINEPFTHHNASGAHDRPWPCAGCGVPAVKPEFERHVLLESKGEFHSTIFIVDYIPRYLQVSILGNKRIIGVMSAHVH